MKFIALGGRRLAGRNTQMNHEIDAFVFGNLECPAKVRRLFGLGTQNGVGNEADLNFVRLDDHVFRRKLNGPGAHVKHIIALNNLVALVPKNLSHLDYGMSGFI